jgi:HEAT repeat protein
MRKGNKRLMVAGALVVAAGAAGLLARHRGGELAVRQRAHDGPSFRGLAATDVSAPALPAAAPETGDQIAAEVTRALESWREAILAKDADSVMLLDRAFLAAPDRYRAALEASAKGERDERVRAFSTRELGKYKNPQLAALFEALLADRSPFVRQNAAWALGELAAQDDGRAAARHAAGELRHARAKDPAPDVRSAAKIALARLD